MAFIWLLLSMLGPVGYSQQASPIPLRNPRSAVVAQYSRMAALPIEQRKEIYGNLPVQMQGDVWTFHLESFLLDHPDLSPEQRAVVYEALGLIQSGALIPDESLRHLELHARAALSAELVDAAFLALGPRAAPLISAKLIPRSLSDCECSTVSDYCCFMDCPTSPTPKCVRGRKSCTLVSSGCGFLWQYGCNGICGE
jgi:hypothetical protein